MTTGERMKRRRKELGLSAEAVAEKLDVSPATVYRYEKGDIEKLPGDILPVLAETLKTTPAYLMGWEETASQKKPLPPGAELPLSTPEASLITSFRELNDEGQEKAIDYVDDLCASGRYKKCGSDGVAAKEA